MRNFFCFSLIFLGIFALAIPANGRFLPNDIFPQPEAAIRLDEGYYFGTIREERGDVACLIKVSGGRISRLMPPANIVFDEPAQKDGVSDHRAKDAYTGLNYVLSLRQSDDLGLEGSIQYGSENEKKSFPLRLDRLEGKDLASTSADVYSSVEYNKESGDLNGETIILFKVKGVQKGIYIPYQDGMVPYSISNVVSKAKKKAFTVALPAQTLKFEIRSKGDRLLVSRSGVDKTVSKTTLKRKNGLSDIFK